MPPPQTRGSYNADAYTSQLRQTSYAAIAYSTVPPISLHARPITSRTPAARCHALSSGTFAPQLEHLQIYPSSSSGPCTDVQHHRHHGHTYARHHHHHPSRRLSGPIPPLSALSPSVSSSASPSPAAAPPSPRSPASQSSSGPPVHEGQVLELECARLALEGKGVCLLPPSGYVVLVGRALPGERLAACVTRPHKGYAEARKLASLAPHRAAVPPPCPLYGPCGGCSLMSLSYNQQLAEKRNQVDQTLRRVGRLGAQLDELAAAG
ncbi:hypothetical protein Agub_g12360, partial [Astrephomene gubernaculifera]